MRGIDGEIAHAGERIAHQSQAAASQARHGPGGQEEILQTTQTLGVAEMRRDVVEGHSAAHENVSQVLRSVHTVIAADLVGIVGLVDGVELLRIPHENRQAGPLQGRQGDLTGRVRQADHQQGVAAGRFVAGNDRLHVFTAIRGPGEPRVGDRRQRRKHAAAKPLLQLLAQRGDKLLVQFEGQGQHAHPRFHLRCVHDEVGFRPFRRITGVDDRGRRRRLFYRA